LVARLLGSGPWSEESVDPIRIGRFISKTANSKIELVVRNQNRSELADIKVVIGRNRPIFVDSILIDFDTTIAKFQQTQQVPILHHKNLINWQRLFTVRLDSISLLIRYRKVMMSNFILLSVSHWYNDYSRV